MSRLRRAILLLLSGALATSMVVGANVTSPAQPAVAAEVQPDASYNEAGSRFTLAVLPDTQFYSRYATEETGNQYQATYGSEPYLAQTQWIADNAATYNTAMTMHLGDIVDQDNHPEQWDVADEAMQVLEDAGQPYSILAGNHDVGAGASDNDPVTYDTYLEHFSPERAAQNSTFVERDPSGAHEYHIFNVDGQDFLVLALSWQAQPDSLQWASDVLDAHPNIPTIVTSHQLINVAADGATPVATDFGELVWNQVIANHDQVFLTFNGHHHGATSWGRTNNAGHPVYQVLMDYQMAYMGGNGYMGLVEFDLTNNKINQTTFSPWVMEKPQDTLVADDRALLNDPGQSFSLDFNFAERFPDLTIGDATDPSYTQTLRDYIGATYTEPGATEQAPATDASDYPVIENTAAHWVMPTDLADGTVLPVGSTIEDIANGNTFTRAELNQGTVTGAQESDVTWSSSHHPLSANFGSVCFDNASNATNTASYFETAADAPINAETFDTGFTFETFVKIDENFAPDDNAWMQWLTRDGQRSEVPGYDGSEPEEPPFAWAISSLTEVQFAFTDTQTPPAEASNWSGEIVNLGEWLHIAVVNDPATHMTTMYIDGVPVLRNSPETLGVNAANAASWVLGAGSYAGNRQSGFYGCVGETRLVTEPLESTQWLTARADDVTPEPTATATATKEPTATTEPTATATAEPTVSPIPTATATASVTPTATPTAAAPAADGSDDGSLATTGAAGLAGLLAAAVALLIAGLLLMLRKRARS